MRIFCSVSVTFAIKKCKKFQKCYGVKIMTKKKTDPYSLRIDDELKIRIERIAQKSGLAKSAILQLCVRAGLPLLESGKVNLIATEPYPLTEVTASRAAESPKKSTGS
jgi:hypothetical protein